MPARETTKTSDEIQRAEAIAAVDALDTLVETMATLRETAEEAGSVVFDSIHLPSIDERQGTEYEASRPDLLRDLFGDPSSNERTTPIEDEDREDFDRDTALPQSRANEMLLRALDQAVPVLAPFGIIPLEGNSRGQIDYSIDFVIHDVATWDTFLNRLCSAYEYSPKLFARSDLSELHDIGNNLCKQIEAGYRYGETDAMLTALASLQPTAAAFARLGLEPVASVLVDYAHGARTSSLLQRIQLADLGFTITGVGAGISAPTMFLVTTPNSFGERWTRAMDILREMATKPDLCEYAQRRYSGLPSLAESARRNIVRAQPDACKQFEAVMDVIDGLLKNPL